jgi:hypothetical protein
MQPQTVDARPFPEKIKSEMAELQEQVRYMTGQLAKTSRSSLAYWNARPGWSGCWRNWQSGMICKRMIWRWSQALGCGRRRIWTSENYHQALR